MSLWDSITNSWDSLTDTVSDWWDEGTDYLGDVTGYNDYYDTQMESYANDLIDSPDAGVGSFLTSSAGDVWDSAMNLIPDTPDWLNVDAAKFATSVGTSLWGESGTPKAGGVKGAKMSGAGRGAASSGSYKASAVDLGYTNKVQNALRTAMNTQVGSGSVEATLAMLRARQSKGPLLQIPEATISVKSKRMRG